VRGSYPPAVGCDDPSSHRSKKRRCGCTIRGDENYEERQTRLKAEARAYALSGTSTSTTARGRGGRCGRGRGRGRDIIQPKTSSTSLGRIAISNAVTKSKAPPPAAVTAAAAPPPLSTSTPPRVLRFT